MENGLQKMKMKPISIINVFILQTSGKPFPVNQYFSISQTLVNGENIFQKLISIKLNGAY